MLQDMLYVAVQFFSFFFKQLAHIMETAHQDSLLNIYDNGLNRTHNR